MPPSPSKTDHLKLGGSKVCSKVDRFYMVRYYSFSSMVNKFSNRWDEVWGKPKGGNCHHLLKDVNSKEESANSINRADPQI